MARMGSEYFAPAWQGLTSHRHGIPRPSEPAGIATSAPRRRQHPNHAGRCEMARMAVSKLATPSPSQESPQENILEIPPAVKDTDDENAVGAHAVDQAVWGNDELAVDRDLDSCQLWDDPASQTHEVQGSGALRDRIEDPLGSHGSILLHIIHDLLEITDRSFRPQDLEAARAHFALIR